MSVTTPTALDADLVCLLSQAQHSLMTELTAGLAEIGISQRGSCVLTHALDGERTQGQLAEMCSLDKTTMVVAVDELEKAGLAERRPSATDRRARIIAVTPKGERVVAEGRRITERIYADVLAALPEEERTVFVSALARLAAGRLSTSVPCERTVRRRAPRVAGLAQP